MLGSSVGDAESRSLVDREAEALLQEDQNKEAIPLFKGGHLHADSLAPTRRSTTASLRNNSEISESYVDDDTVDTSFDRSDDDSIMPTKEVVLGYLSAKRKVTTWTEAIDQDDFDEGGEDDASSDAFSSSAGMQIMRLSANLDEVFDAIGLNESLGALSTLLQHANPTISNAAWDALAVEMAKKDAFFVVALQTNFDLDAFFADHSDLAKAKANLKQAKADVKGMKQKMLDWRAIFLQKHIYGSSPLQQLAKSGEHINSDALDFLARSMYVTEENMRRLEDQLGLPEWDSSHAPSLKERIAHIEAVFGVAFEKTCYIKVRKFKKPKRKCRPAQLYDRLMFAQRILRHMQGTFEEYIDHIKDDTFGRLYPWMQDGGAFVKLIRHWQSDSIEDRLAQLSLVLGDEPPPWDVRTQAARIAHFEKKVLPYPLLNSSEPGAWQPSSQDRLLLLQVLTHVAKVRVSALERDPRLFGCVSGAPLEDRVAALEQKVQRQFMPQLELDEYEVELRSDLAFLQSSSRPTAEYILLDDTTPDEAFASEYSRATKPLLSRLLVLSETVAGRNDKDKIDLFAHSSTAHGKTLPIEARISAMEAWFGERFVRQREGVGIIVDKLEAEMKLRKAKWKRQKEKRRQKSMQKKEIKKNNKEAKKASKADKKAVKKERKRLKTKI